MKRSTKGLLLGALSLVWIGISYLGGWVIGKKLGETIFMVDGQLVEE